MEDYVGYAVNLQTAAGVSYKGVVYKIDSDAGSVTLVDVVEFLIGVPPTTHATMTFNGDNVTDLTIDESIPVVDAATLQSKMYRSTAAIASTSTPYVDPAIISSTVVDPAIISSVAAPAYGFSQQQSPYGGFSQQPRGGRGFNQHTQQYAGQRGNNNYNNNNNNNGNNNRGGKRDANSRNMDTFGEVGGVQHPFQQQGRGGNAPRQTQTGPRGPRPQQGFQQQQHQQPRQQQQQRPQRAPRSNEPVGLLGADAAAPLKEQFKEDLDLSSQTAQIEQERRAKQAEMAAQIAAGYSGSSFFDNLSSDKNKIYGNPQDGRRKEVNLETFGAERVPKGQAGFGGRRRFHSGNKQN